MRRRTDFGVKVRLGSTSATLAVTLAAGIILVPFLRRVPELRIEKSVPVSDTLYLNVTPDSLRIAIPMASFKAASTLPGEPSYPVYGDGVILYPSVFSVSMIDNGRYYLTINAVAIVK